MEAQQNFNIEEDKKAFEAIQKELQDIEKSIESDFVTFISDKIDNDPALEELFFSNRKEFFTKIIDEQNKYVKELVTPKINKLQELDTIIQNKQELGNLEAIKQQFQAQHPEVNIQELILFFTQDLPPKIQEEIKAQPIEDFFNIVYELFKQGQEAQAQDQKLPAQTQGVPVSNDALNTTQDLPMNRN